MPANKYALLRYRIIDRCLTNSASPYPSKDDMREACEEALYGSFGDHISESTIEKDLWAMRNESELGYYAPIKYHKGEKGYYYEDPEYTIQDISLNDDDLGAIHFAAATLFQFKDIPVFQQFEHAIEKIVDRLNVSPEGKSDNLESIVQFETAGSVPGKEHFGTLVSAIQQEKAIQIEYQKFQDNSTKSYALSPLLLKEYRNRWYLISFDKSFDSYKTFGLERIEQVSLIKDGYFRPKDFDSDRFFKNSLGITEISDTPRRIILKCSTLLSKYLISQPLHPSQKVISTEGDEVVIELNILVTYELVNIILSYGSQIEVIEPLDLRVKITSLLEETLKKYSDRK